VPGGKQRTPRAAPKYGADCWNGSSSPGSPLAYLLTRRATPKPACREPPRSTSTPLTL
jgi:hypothetical protein